jgi:hypothetical protein
MVNLLIRKGDIGMIKGLLFLLLLIPNVAFANGLDSTLVSVYLLGKILIALLGGGLCFIGITKFAAYSTDSRNPKNSLNAALVTLFAGSLLLNISGTISIIQNTFNQGSSGFCFYAESAENPHMADSCFQDSNIISDRYLSEVRGESPESTSMKKFRDKVRLILSMAQLIGLFYFVKGLLTLKSVSEGKDNTTYGKVLIMIFASALVMDASHTVDMLVETINSWRDSI